MKTMTKWVGVLAFLMGAQLTWAIGPEAQEMALARSWVAAKLEGVQESPQLAMGLVVRANLNAVQRNGRRGRPLRIVDTDYTRGLYCHAFSEVLVRLPGPGRTFSAVVGMDSNSQTAAGLGTIRFSVKVTGEEAYRSDVIRVETPGVLIEVDLAGASEFVLEVGGAGDNITCDQADWADAKVVMADGSTVWLGDMPMIDVDARPHSTDPPFSFVYGSRPSSELLPGWERTHEARELDDERTEHVLSYTDPESGLVVRCVGVEYHDYPTVEWTVYFKNTGSADTPILEDIQGLDATLCRVGSSGGSFVLHHFKGSQSSPSDYEPYETPLAPGATKRITTSGGRSTNSDWSYFNLECLGGSGVIVAVGWPGQWAIEFTREGERDARARCGQELTHLTLHPGEEIRTPLIVVQFWNRQDWVGAQNVWRRWMIRHNLPRPGGELPKPLLAAAIRGYGFCMYNSTAEDNKMFIDTLLANGVDLDYWWMDTGWFYHTMAGHGFSYDKLTDDLKKVYDEGRYWELLAIWEADRTRYPNGIREISDHAHSKGLNTVLWFEPERVDSDSWVYKAHPEWTLKSSTHPHMLVNLGHPEALAWMNDRIDHVLNAEGVDVYRVDFNFDPLDHWRENDSPDRQGIGENHWCQGFLAHWDEMLERNPALLIDSCASGGRRNDLESMRRSVPLWRSDYWGGSTGEQGMTYGLSFWLPYFGHGGDLNFTKGKADNAYSFRSNMFPAIVISQDVRNADLDYEFLRRSVAEWREVAPYFMGDYYPLTPYNLGDEVWMAWQFDRPDLGRGMVQAFRRSECPYEAASFPLRGLEAESRYTVRDFDREDTHMATGQELMDKGIGVAIDNRPGAVVLTYTKLQ